MTVSRFVGYEKHFFSIPVTEQTPKLYLTTATLLRGKESKYAPHLSLLTMHLKKESDIAREIDETKANFFSQMSELAAPLVIDEDKVTNRRCELLGKSPECFCLVFDLVDCGRLQMLQDFWITTLCDKYKLTKGIEEEGICDLTTSDGEVLAHISSTDIKDKKLHTTLVSSFDLKNCNKSFHKKYYSSEDRLAYLAAHYGEL